MYKTIQLRDLEMTVQQLLYLLITRIIQEH